jgi:hypothetical protein
MNSPGPSRCECLRVLGLDESAAFEQIRQAYHRLALQHHPDRNGGSEEATTRFIEIAIAYARLAAEARITEFREKAVPPHEMPVVSTAARPHRKRTWTRTTWSVSVLLGTAFAGVVLIACFLAGGSQTPLSDQHARTLNQKDGATPVREQEELLDLSVDLSDRGPSLKEPAIHVSPALPAGRDSAWSRYIMSGQTSQQEKGLDARMDGMQTYLGWLPGVTVVEAHRHDEGFCVTVVIDGKQQDVRFSDPSFWMNQREANAWYTRATQGSTQPASTTAK